MRVALVRNGVVENIIASDLDFANTLGYDHAVEAGDAAAIGWTYENGVLSPPVVPPPTPRPVLKLTDAISDDPQNTIISPEFDEVTCREGAIITFDTELRNPVNDQVIPITQMFRMPVKSRDNREFLVLVNMVNGLASVAIKFDSSGVWSATEETMNSGLSDAEKLTFSGIRVYVVR
jgi:hypothetical protein